MTTLRKPTVYLETSTISYLAAREPRDIHRKSKQLITRKWWDTRDKYELFVSETVLEEIEQGDPVAAALRLDVAVGIPSLVYNDAVEELAQAIVRAGAIPTHVIDDALHIGYAAVHNMNVLLTWNQKHIAAPAKQFLIREIILSCNFRVPQILTPEAHLLMLEDTYHDRY